MTQEELKKQMADMIDQIRADNGDLIASMPADANNRASRGCSNRLVVHLPDLWEEIAPGKVWARATKNVNGENMGLKCELKLIGGKFRWMTLNPQKFGVADTLDEAIEQVESFLHNGEHVRLLPTQDISESQDTQTTNETHNTDAGSGLHDADCSISSFVEYVRKAWRTDTKAAKYLKIAIWVWLVNLGVHLVILCKALINLL